MKSNIWLRIVACVLLIPIFVIIGFIGMIITSFNGHMFYTAFVGIAALAIIAFTVIGLFSLLKKRPYIISMIVFFSLCIVSVIGYEGYQMYYNSIPVSSSQDVDLTKYEPFAPHSKAVSLEEPATFTIEDNLPRLDGATALYPVYAAFAQATYPENDYNRHYSAVMANQTGNAYNNLIHGDVDIIFAAGPSKRQLEYAEQRGVELQLTPIGKEAFVFFVHARNPVEGLTIDQIQRIYSGEITNWSEVGGSNQSIRAFQRPADSGSQTALERLMGDIPLMDPPADNIVSGMGEIISETADYRNHRNALGYSFRYFSTEMVQNGDIRLLEIEGVFPDKESIKSGAYPITAEFYAITAGSDNPHVEAFIEWMLSEQGQFIVEQTGYVPVK